MNFRIRDVGRKSEDIGNRNTGQRAILYYLVAIYIGYMGYSVIKNRLAGDDTMTYPLAILLSLVLILGAAFVVFYATWRMKKEKKQSMTGTDGNEENKD